MFGMFSKIFSVFSRFKSKKTTIEKLEELDKEIKSMEKFKLKNQSNEKKYIGALVLYSILLYIVGAVIYYIYLMPKNMDDRIQTLIPFFITPLIIYVIRRFLKWFFIKRTTYYEQRLNDLTEEKKKILEEVKENETYKKAREILERFSGGTDINITPPTSPMNETVAGNSNMTPFNQTMPKHPRTNLNNTNLVHRNINNTRNNNNVPESRSVNLAAKSTPMPGNGANRQAANEQNNNNNNRLNESRMPAEQMASNLSMMGGQPSASLTNLNQTQHANPQQATRALLPRPIMAPDRTFFDKLLDFVIGEGPNNRYALICKNCHFHNGMALKEEFEYIAFRCAYCLFYNESRKTKLAVPKLNTNKPAAAELAAKPLANMSSTLNAKAAVAAAPRRVPMASTNNNDDDSLIDTGSYLSTLVNKKPPPSQPAENAGNDDAVDGGGHSEAYPSTTLSSSNSLDDLASLSEPVVPPPNEPDGWSKSTKTD